MKATEQILAGQNTHIETMPLNNYASESVTITSYKKFDLYKAFWIFLFGSVFGFVIETMWCLFKNGVLECRSSMIFGPFVAVYGIGALFLYLGMQFFPDKNKILHIFIFGCVAGTVVEYLFSFIQEVFFGSVSWDYSGKFLNIGGRVCLQYSVFWGLLTIVWYILIQPLFEKLIAKIPERIYKPLTMWTIAFISINIILSIAAVTRWGMRLDGIPAGNMIATLIDRVFSNEFMETVYPNMLW